MIALVIKGLGQVLAPSLLNVLLHLTQVAALIILVIIQALQSVAIMGRAQLQVMNAPIQIQVHAAMEIVLYLQRMLRAALMCQDLLMFAKTASNAVGVVVITPLPSNVVVKDRPLVHAPFLVPVVVAVALLAQKLAVIPIIVQYVHPADLMLVIVLAVMVLVTRLVKPKVMESAVATLVFILHVL